jgi:predicted permease
MKNAPKNTKRTTIYDILSYFNVPILKIGVLDSLLQMLGGMALPLALLSIGVRSKYGVSGKNRPILIAGTINLLAMPVVVCLRLPRRGARNESHYAGIAKLSVELCHGL